MNILESEKVKKAVSKVKTKYKKVKTKLKVKRRTFVLFLFI